MPSSSVRVVVGGSSKLIRVFIDGLCEPVNPGGVATFGFSVYRDSLKLEEKAGAVGEGSSMSNNVAEYSALCEVLKSLLARGLGGEEVIVHSDSRLLVNQMSGHWKARRGLYLRWHDDASLLVRGFKNIFFKWIPREENSEADALSRRAYKEHSKQTRG
ncbi:MAG: ribonuclease [Thermoproteota archaeon]|nr:ribonuclease [Thermoproteota archaeon]